MINGGEVEIVSRGDRRWKNSSKMQQRDRETRDERRCRDPNLLFSLGAYTLPSNMLMSTTYSQLLLARTESIVLVHTVNTSKMRSDTRPHPSIVPIVIGRLSLRFPPFRSA